MATDEERIQKLEADMKGIKEAMQKLSDRSLERSWKESIDQSLKKILGITFKTHKEASQQNFCADSLA
jgi:hypothetical protein